MIVAGCLHPSCNTSPLTVLSDQNTRPWHPLSLFSFLIMQLFSCAATAIVLLECRIQWRTHLEINCLTIKHVLTIVIFSDPLRPSRNPPRFLSYGAQRDPSDFRARYVIIRCPNDVFVENRYKTKQKRSPFSSELFLPEEQRYAKSTFISVTSCG